jgi:hypothetical protein
MRLVPIDFSDLARIDIGALDIELDDEEILADLLYPAGPQPAGRRGR